METLNIEIHPATVDRFADLRSILAPRQAHPSACWCLTYRLSDAENSALRGEERPMRLRRLCEAQHAPGVLAYVAGVPAGWCALGPRDEFERLRRSRTIQVLDDLPVWSIVCLVVRSAFRRKGVARALVAGAVEYAASQGAQAVEAYPIETDGARVSSAFAFTGTTRLFGGLGFVQCAVTRGRSGGRPRVIMRRFLRTDAPAAQ